MRKHRSRTFVLLVSLVAWHATVRAGFCQEPTCASVASPDGKNAIVLGIDGTSGGRVSISVARNGEDVVSLSAIDLRLDGGISLAAGARIRAVDDGTLDKTFDLLWGKTRTVRNRGSWARVQLANESGIEWEIELQARDDGVAFRYRLPEQPSLKEFKLAEETTEYRLAPSPTVLFTACKNFRTDHESEFQRRSLDELPRQTLIDLPFLVVWPDGRAAAITEARVLDFTNMYLERTAATDRVVLRARLSPLPGQPGMCVVGRCPHVSPWRVVLLGDRAGDLLESNLLLCLNDERPAATFPGPSRARRPGTGGTGYSKRAPRLRLG